jgi:hypothetical protein
MSALQSSLPGLFAPTAQAAHVASLSPAGAVQFLARTLMSVAQACGQDLINNTVDRKLQADQRYRIAMSQAVTLSLWATEDSRRHAHHRNVFLSKVIREAGGGGIAGKLARVALILGRAAQSVDVVQDMTEAFSILDQAIVLHALQNDKDAGAARAAYQLSLLNFTNSTLH